LTEEIVVHFSGKKRVDLSDEAKRAFVYLVRKYKVKADDEFFTPKEKEVQIATR